MELFFQVAISLQPSSGIRMYQALYRKWRPRTFDDVVGQEHITSTLKRQVETGRLSHAYLFSGTRGTGKTTCARILARAVNCENPVNGNPCNQCSSCRGILSESILDVMELDAASHNGVDDVRALRDEAIFSPVNVKKRVYIIDEAHSLSAMAFNALLKILEEPPEHVMFILCTTAPQKILPTIVSRCQRHNFTRIEADVIASRLTYVATQEGMFLEPAAAALLARMADGGMRDALSLLDQCSAAEKIDEAAVLSALGLAGSRRTAQLLEAVAGGNVEQALKSFSALWQDGKEPAGILEELAGLMRDVLLLQVSPKGGQSLVSGVYEIRELQRFAQKIPGAQLMDWMKAIRAADTGGSDPRRAAEMCLIGMCVPETSDSLQGLKNRVAKLEMMLQNGVPAIPTAEKKQPNDSADENQAKDLTSSCIQDTEKKQLEPAKIEFVKEQPAGLHASEAPAAAPLPESKGEEADTDQQKESAEDLDKADVWETLVKSISGKLDMAAHAMLSTPTQVTASLSEEKMTITLRTPIAKAMLDKPEVKRILQEQLSLLLNKTIRVVFEEKNTSSAGKPEIEKLNELSRFPNVKFI